MNMDGNMKPAKNDKPAKESKEENGIKERAEARKLYGEDEKEKKKEVEQQQEISCNVNVEPRRRKTRQSALKPTNDENVVSKDVPKGRSSIRDYLRKSTLVTGEGGEKAKRQSSMAADKRTSSVAGRASYAPGTRASGIYPLKVLNTPKDGLKSTTTSSVSSSASNGFLQIIGTFCDTEHPNVIKATDNSVEVFDMTPNNPNKILTIPMDDDPVLIQLMKSPSQENILFILTKNRKIWLYKYKNGNYDKVFAKTLQAEFTESLPKPLSSFDPFSHILVFAVDRSHIMFIHWNNGGPSHETVLVHNKTLLNLLLMSHQDGHLRVITQSRGTMETNTCMSKYVRKLDIDTLELEEYGEPLQRMTPGHLVAIPYPICGHLELGSYYFQYYSDNGSIINKIENAKHQKIEYTAFGVLSSSKVLALTKDQRLYLVQLVVDSPKSIIVAKVQFQMIQHHYLISDFYVCNEFMILLKMKDRSQKFMTLKRGNDSMNYTLMETDEITNIEKKTSLPLMTYGYHQVKLQDKFTEVQISDILNEKWKIIKKIGSGACGNVYEARNLHENTMNVVVKVQPNMYQSEIKNEIEFLRLLRRKNYTYGFPRLYDVFEWFNSLTCVVMSKEGATIESLLERSKQFSSSNCKAIFQKLIKIVTIIDELEYAHQDIHIGNVMLKKSENKINLSIIDFGRTEKNKQDLELETWSIWDDCRNCYTIVRQCAGKDLEKMKWIGVVGKAIDSCYEEKKSPLPMLVKMLEGLKAGEIKFEDKDGDDFTML